jgi:NAD(P)-dependent dehydrogenase (short-subunit alcohol dehydrogenase family)
VHATYTANGPEISKNAPRGRPGQLAELAPAYVLLASNHGSSITDTIIPVTGGRPML